MFTKRKLTYPINRLLARPNPLLHHPALLTIPPLPPLLLLHLPTLAHPSAHNNHNNLPRTLHLDFLLAAPPRPQHILVKTHARQLGIHAPRDSVDGASAYGETGRGVVGAVAGDVAVYCGVAG